MIKRDWIKRWKRLPDRQQCRVVMSLDTAGNGNPSSSFSACTVWWQHGPKHYLVDVMRERLDYSDLRARILQLREKHQPDVTLIENKIIGMGLADDLRKNWLMNVVLIDPKGDKEARLALVQPMFEGHEVLIPIEEEPKFETYLAELLSFPEVKHNDQVDSTTQYLNWARNGGGNGFSYSFIGRDEPDPSLGNLWNPMEHAYPLNPPPP